MSHNFFVLIIPSNNTKSLIATNKRPNSSIGVASKGNGWAFIYFKTLPNTMIDRDAVQSIKVVFFFYFLS